MTIDQAILSTHQCTTPKTDIPDPPVFLAHITPPHGQTIEAGAVAASPIQVKSWLKD